jgi:AcrR family transcriptional regulator
MENHRIARKKYANHRENQRERILDAAQRLFNRDGIDQVSISAIAHQARITRATLYGYFPDKQEIAWAIFKRTIENWRIDTDMLSTDGTGYQRIERLLKSLAGGLESQPESLRFIVEFNTLYAREGNPARVRSTIEQARSDGYSLLTQMIHEGIQDGSLRPDLDPILLSAALMNLINALSSRFVLLGDLIREEYDQPVMGLYEEILRVVFRGIQSNSNIQETIE